MHVITQAGAHADAVPVAGSLVLLRGVVGEMPRLVPSPLLFEEVRCATERRRGPGERRTETRAFRGRRRADWFTAEEDRRVADLWRKCPAWLRDGAA